MKPKPTDYERHRSQRCRRAHRRDGSRHREERDGIQKALTAATATRAMMSLHDNHGQEGHDDGKCIIVTAWLPFSLLNSHNASHGRLSAKPLADYAVDQGSRMFPRQMWCPLCPCLGARGGCQMSAHGLVPTCAIPIPSSNSNDMPPSRMRQSLVVRTHFSYVPGTTLKAISSISSKASPHYQ